MTTRPILCSEYAIVREAFRLAKRTPPTSIMVVKEEYGRSRANKKQLFNVDFSLWFLPTLPSRANRDVVAVPMAQNSIGAEVFVTIRNDNVPALCELIGGESIPKSSFVKSLRRIDAAIGNSFGRSIETARYLRIAELTDGISFLAATDDLSIFRGTYAHHQTTEIGEWNLYRSVESGLMIEGFVQV